PPGTPNLDLNLANPPTAALATGAPIQRTAYEEKLPPPLRVVEQTPATSTHDQLLADLTGTDASTDSGSRRRAMRPANAESSDGDSAPAPTAKSPAALPDAILMAVPESKDPKDTKASADAGPRREKHDASLPPGSPAVRMVSSKRIVLNYHVKDVGPSGLSGIELWWT